MKRAKVTTHTNLAEVREIHPGLKDFGTWLERESGFVKR
jgi:hypothetical protein